MANYYELLEIPVTASKKEIESAIDQQYTYWHGLVTHHDPSKVEEANRSLRLLEEARSVLTNSTKRKKYDAEIGLKSDKTAGLADPQATVMHAKLPSMNVAQNVTHQESVQATTDVWICGKCKTSNRIGLKFCAKCGTQIGQECVKCNKIISMADRFCPHCGIDIAKERIRQIEQKREANRQREEKEARQKALLQEVERQKEMEEAARISRQREMDRRLAEEKAKQIVKEKAAKQRRGIFSTLIIIVIIMWLCVIPPLRDQYNMRVSQAQAIHIHDVTMSFVPAGKFTMGQKNLFASSISPIHTVYLSDYYIDQTEVANVAYRKCVDAGVCQPPYNTSSSTRSNYYGNSEFDNYPVIYVDWNMANTYCVWRDARLPTESEWEKSARGTDGRYFPWNTWESSFWMLVSNNHSQCDKANYRGCLDDTTKVGSYEDGKSPYGVYDMAGNVQEWVNDWYDRNYYQNSPLMNPLGPDYGTERVMRGGSWAYAGYANSAASSYRDKDDPTRMETYGRVGFRCARTP